MQFDDISLCNKKKYLDIILSKPDIIQKVISRNINGDWTIEEIPRVWEPGGGSTLFKLEASGKKYVLKIKHRSVTVESKLEEEANFIKESSLEHEKNMLKMIDEEFVPQILFWDEEEEMQFLAMEYIELSLIEYISSASISEVLRIWTNLDNVVKKLYDKDIVHCDLHENNIRCRQNGDIVLIDFEESRKLKQNTTFEESLDYVGMNDNSKLGEFPHWKHNLDFSTKYNCLNRMKDVFKQYIIKLLPIIVSECNYDSTNGICTALDHGKSDKVYQSINTKYMKVEGQRGFGDNRVDVLKQIVDILFEKENFTFVDIGSNNGNFCRAIAEQNSKGAYCIGLEGFSKFNVLARALSFIEDYNIKFIDFVCGEDDFSDISINHPCIVSICSVWHHIQNKEIFLQQLKKQKVEYIFLELATQPECYQGHTWQEELDAIVKQLGFRTKEVIMFSKDYKRPLILIAKDEIDELKLKKLRMRD